MSFSLERARSVDHALKLARSLRGSVHFIAGGTDLIVQMHSGRRTPEHLVDITLLDELRRIEERDGVVVIGSLVTLSAIERSPILQREMLALPMAARLVGGPQIRNRATIGGNIVNASPAADTLPPLLAFDAEVALLSDRGERWVALSEFLVGPGKTTRRSDELLTHVRFKCPPTGSRSCFMKAGRRRAMEISVAAVAVRLSIAAGSGKCSEVRIALGAVNATAVRALEAERILEGSTQDVTIERVAGVAASEACRPISDLRSSAEYRRHLVATLVPRAVQTCLNTARLQS